MLALGTNSVFEVGWKFLSDGKDAFGSLESVATVAAIVLGGIWTYKLFVSKRENYPKASLTQSHASWKLANGNRLVRIELTIKNEGDVLLRIPSGYTWVQQMKPWPEELLKQEVKGQEVPWPLITSRDMNDGYEIEPKEIDVIPMEFIINEDFTQILVYSFIKNQKKKCTGWMITTIVSFDEEERIDRHSDIMRDQDQETIKRQGLPKERPQQTEQPPRWVHEQGQPKERPNPAREPVKKVK